MDFLKEKFMVSEQKEYLLKEFAHYLETVTTLYLEETCGLGMITQFADSICSDEPIIIENKYFVITLNPTITEKIQIRRSSITGGKTSQLVIKKSTDTFDTQKLQAMFLANLAHTFDSEIVHQFIYLCYKINDTFESYKRGYRIIFEKTHDCFSIK